MQNTRLNNLFDAISRNLGQWFINPWRRISLLIMSFLVGIFMSTVVATTAGQQESIDIVIAALLQCQMLILLPKTSLYIQTCSRILKLHLLSCYLLVK